MRAHPFETNQSDYQELQQILDEGYFEHHSIQEYLFGNIKAWSDRVDKFLRAAGKITACNIEIRLFEILSYI